MKSNRNYQAYKQVRKGWGELKPTERVVPSQKPYKRREKFQRDFLAE